MSSGPTPAVMIDNTGDPVSFATVAVSFSTPIATVAADCKSVSLGALLGYTDNQGYCASTTAFNAWSYIVNNSQLLPCASQLAYSGSTSINIPTGSSVDGIGIYLYTMTPAQGTVTSTVTITITKGGTQLAKVCLTATVAAGANSVTLSGLTTC